MMKWDCLADPLEGRHPGLVTHPIERDLDPGPRWMAPLAALPVLACLAAVLLMISVVPRQARPMAPLAVPVSLQTQDALEWQPPAGSKRRQTDPDRWQGEGHRSGTGSIDPSLLRLELPATAPQTVPTLSIPDTVPLELPAAPQMVSLRRDLPVSPGGNGLPQGRGRDLGRGGIRRREDLMHLANAWVWPEDPVTRLPEGLRILRRVNASSGDASLPSEGVLVIILIAGNGRVIDVKAVTGVKSQFDVCEAAARQWLFWVDPLLQAQAPFPFRIRFVPPAQKAAPPTIF